MTLNLTDIMIIVKKITGLSFDEMKANRKPESLFARYLIMILANEEKIKLNKIADFLGLMPSSVSNGLKAINDLLLYNKDFKTKYLACIAEIAKLEESEVASV